MNKIKNTREVLKNIPSIDQIIKKFVNSDLSIPIDFDLETTFFKSANNGS